jgi:Asp-tRNA(Asn)/Glu-tRNA(Gln) amidotransferase A subunit family amidase
VEPERTPGGSSGGEAAAIASFCSAGGIGSDGGGSIRIPAHFCGIAGLKPTPGRISANGHFPVMNHPGGLLSVAGPLARSAEDLRLLFAALAGYDSQDPFSVPVPLQPPGEPGLRVGVVEQFYSVPVDPEIRQTVRRAAQNARRSHDSHRAFRAAGSGARAESVVVLLRAVARAGDPANDPGPRSRRALDRHRIPRRRAAAEAARSRRGTACC